MQKVVVYLGKPTKKDLEKYSEEIQIQEGEKANLFKLLKPYSLQLIKGIIMFKCNGFDNEKEEKRVKEELERLNQLAQVNIFTIKKHEKDYLNNMFDNLKLDFSPAKVLFGKINKPCVIISAGPSLDKNLKDLDRGKVIVICVAPVLEKLNKLGVCVDFVVSMDTSDSNMKHFKNLTKYPPLVFDCGVNSEIIKNYKGPKYMSFGNSPVANELSFSMGKIDTGMSVSHYAYNFASKLGCEEIILLGQDLALTNDKLHCEGVNSTEEQEEIIEVNGYYGNPVKTTSRMSNYIFIFEELIQEYNSIIKCYNCTEGGALIRGATNKSLKEVMDKLNIFTNESMPYYKETKIDLSYEEKMLKKFIKKDIYHKKIGRMINQLAIDIYLNDKMTSKEQKKILISSSKFLYNKMIELRGDNYAKIFKIK